MKSSLNTIYYVFFFFIFDMQRIRIKSILYSYLLSSTLCFKIIDRDSLVKRSKPAIKLTESFLKKNPLVTDT